MFCGRDYDIKAHGLINVTVLHPSLAKLFFCRPLLAVAYFIQGDFIKVFVKEVFPGNGRFRLTMDANLDPKSVKTMTNKVQKEKSRFARRKNVEDLVVGEEMLGAIVKVREG